MREVQLYPLHQQPETMVIRLKYYLETLPPVSLVTQVVALVTQEFVCLVNLQLQCEWGAQQRGGQP